VLRPNVTLGGTRLTRQSLSRVMYFLDYTMYRRVKYKGDPERHFPLRDALHSVKNWDPSYDLVDVERVYSHWVARRRQNGGIQEKALIRNFQEPPDSNDDDSNVAFRPRVSDERHVATRRQTKKPKKNTLDSYLRLKSLRDNLQKTCAYLRKLREMELMKRRMALRAIEQRQSAAIHSSPYVRDRAKALDALAAEGAADAVAAAKLSALFGTFSSPILRRESASEWVGATPLSVDDLNSMSNHFKDVATFRKKWETVCNRMAVAKTDGIVDVVKDQFGHFTPRYTDRVIQQLFPKEVLPLSRDAATMRMPRVRDFELTENRPFHWELPGEGAGRALSRCIDDDDDDGEGPAPKEEGVVARRQRAATVQQRLVDSLGARPQFRYTARPEDVCPVAVPAISRDGALSISVYHPLVETTDEVEYAPTVGTHSAATDTVFDEFQIPMEPQLVTLSAKKAPSKQRSGIGRKRKHRAVSQSPPKLHQQRAVHLNCGLPPAPKRQKLLNGANHINAANAANAAPLGSSAAPNTAAPHGTSNGNSSGAAAANKGSCSEPIPMIAAANGNGTGPITANWSKNTKGGALSRQSLSTMQSQHNKHRQQYIELQQQSQSKLRPAATEPAAGSASSAVPTANGSVTAGGGPFAAATAAAAPSAHSSSAPQSVSKSPASGSLSAAERGASKKRQSAASSASSASKKKKKKKSKKKTEKTREEKEAKRKEKQKKKDSKASKKRAKPAASSQRNTLSVYPGFGPSTKKEPKAKASRASKSSAKHQASGSTAGSSSSSGAMSNGHSNGGSNGHLAASSPSSSQRVSCPVVSASEGTTTSTISSLSSSGNVRLPTPDGQPLAAGGGPIAASMSTMAIPKFIKELDIKFDPQMMSNLNMGTAVGAGTASAAGSATKAVDAAPRTPPATLLPFNGVEGRPKKAAEKGEAPKAKGVANGPRVADKQRKGTRAVAATPKQLAAAAAMSARAVPYPSAYGSVPNVAPVVAMPPNNVRSAAASAPSAANGNGNGSVPVANPMSAPQQTQPPQQLNAAGNSSSNRQMASMSVPSVPSIPRLPLPPQLPQQRSPSSSRAASSFSVPQSANSQGADPRNGSPKQQSMASNMSSFGAPPPGRQSHHQSANAHSAPHIASNYGRGPPQQPAPQQPAPPTQTQQQRAPTKHHLPHSTTNSGSHRHVAHPQQPPPPQHPPQQQHPQRHATQRAHHPHSRMSSQQSHGQRAAASPQHHHHHHHHQQSRPRVSGPPYSTYSGHSSVPLPPSASAMANPMASQYRGSGHSVARPGGSGRSGRMGHSGHIPQFAATAPNSMGSGGHHHHPMSYQHRAPGVNGRGHMMPVPLSPMQKHQAMNGMHPNARNKRLNGKPEIIEIDK